MNRPVIASFLCLSLLAPVIPTSAQSAPNSPENLCIKELIKSAKTNTAFSGVDFNKLTKANGPEGAKIESGEFSIKDYNDFLAISQTPVPLIDADLPAFPDDLSRVAPSYTEVQGVHKTNRNNGAYILYGDGTSTSIGDIDGDGADETIDGYYIDSRYVSFGDQSDLDFSFPTRDPKPADDREFPMGAPLKDMREYLMFTHHLAPKFGGDFMSCGLVKMTPSGDYALKSYAGEKSIRWAYYGLPKPKQTNVRESVKNAGGKKFRVGDIRFIVSAKEVDPLGGYDFSNNLLTFNVLVAAYDNKNSFMNEFETLKIFEENMNDASKATSSFMESRLSFYKDLADKSSLGIIGNATTNANDEEPEPGKQQASLDGRLLMANLLETENDQTPRGGLSIMPGVSLETYEKVESIEDEATRNMLRSALVPDYGGMLANFTEKDESDMNEFEKAYNSYPLTYEERVENVEYILARADDVEKLNPDNFEYKDMVFGEAVIPVTDRRLRNIVEEDYISTEMKRLQAEKEAELAQFQITEGMSITQEQEMYRKQDQIEREYAAALSKLITFENEYKDFKIKFTDIENKLVNGRISESDYESERKKLFNQFNNTVKTGQLGDVVSAEKLTTMSDDLISANKAVSNASPEAKDNKEYDQNKMSMATLFVKMVAAVFFLLALALAFFAVKKIRNKKSY